MKRTTAFLKRAALALPVLALMVGYSQTATAALLTWNNSTQNSQWDTNSLNWLNSGSPTIWNNSTPDSAYFGVLGFGTVNVTTNITASSITFDHLGYAITNGTLTLAGPGPAITNNADATIDSSLVGTDGLTKQGAAKLTLDNATYTGSTVVSAGTLNIVQGTGFASADVTVDSGATLNFDTTGGTTPQAAVMLESTAYSMFTAGSGVVSFTGSGFIELGGNNNSFDTKFNLASGGMFDVQGDGVDACDVQFIAYTTAASFGNNLGGLNVAVNCSFHNGQAAYQFDALTGEGTVGMGQGYPGNTAPVLSTLTLGVNNTLDNAAYGVTNHVATFSGSLVDSEQYGSVTTGVLNLVKTGTGTQILSGANSYSGSTTVSGGTLVMTNGIPSADAVAVSGGGTLVCQNTIYGPVTLYSGGTLALGGTGAGPDVGTLSLASALTLNVGGTNYMRITKTGGTPAFDQVHVPTGILNNGGTLVVANITSDGTPLAVSDTFNLFGGVAAGNFGNYILPALPAGLIWDVSQLPVSGAIAVGNVLPAPTFSLAGGGYVGAQVVAISSTAPGATIYYTTNGSAPTESSAVYSGPIPVPVNATLTIKAIAHAAGIADSAVASATYVTESKAVWTNMAGGSWAQASNWTNGIIANQSGATADFSQLTLQNSPTTVTLDGGWNIGGLIFGDQGDANPWEIDAGNGGTLTLAAANGATITVVNQMATITAPVAGVTSLTTAGQGALWLSGADRYSGGTTISSGTLVANNTLALGAATSTLTLGDANTGTNAVNFATDAGVAGAVTLAAINTTSNGPSQTITLNAGSALAGNSSELTVGTLNLNGDVPLTIQSGTSTDHSTAQDIFYRVAGSGVPAGETALILDGTQGRGLRTSFVNGAAPNNFTGDVVIQGHVNTQCLTYNGQTAGNQNLNFLHNNVTVSNVVDAVNATLWTVVWGGETVGALNGDGNISLNCQNALNNIGLTIGNTGASGTYAGAISGGFGVAKVGSGTQTLSGTNTYTGSTTVSAGALNVVAHDTVSCIGSSSALNLGAGTTLGFADPSSVTVASINVGSLSVTGAVSVNITGTVGSGQMPLIKYSGSRTGAGTFTLGTAPAGATLLDDLVNKAVYVVTPGPVSIVTDLPGTTDTRYVGATYTLSVVAGGSPVHYQWLKNGTIPVGTDSPTLTLTGLTTGDAGRYSVTVTNAVPSSAHSATNTLALIPAPTGYGAMVLASGPSAYWRLDEADGTTAFDYAGGNNATYSGSFTLGTPGLITGDPDTAVDFSGGTATAPISASLNPPQFTVEFWAMPADLNAEYVVSLQDRTTGTRTGYAIQKNNFTSGWDFSFGTGPSSYNTISSGTPVVAGSVYYVAATYDGTTARLYINGALTSSLATTYQPATSAQPGFTIGSRNGSNAMIGVLDEVAVYNRALTAQEIQSHAQNAPIMQIGKAGGKVILTWPGGGTLQAAPVVTGPYANVPAATSPWTNTASAGQEFFRVQQ